MNIGINPLPMKLSDVELVWQLDRKVFEFPWTKKNFQDSVAACHGCYKWMLGRDIIGYLVMMTVHDESHLLTIGIDPELQGRGLGTTMVNFALEKAAEEGAHSMFLEVRERNRQAIRLYEKLGFVEVGRRRDYYPQVNGREDALIYAATWGNLGFALAD